MEGSSTRFPALFKKYRLKAEFSTLSQLGGALAEKGLIYEDSIFSHWQKGSRIPHDRNVLLKLLQVFIERRAITTIDQANDFLSSAKQGYLSEIELDRIPVKLTNPIFQVPNEIEHFTGREEIIENISTDSDIYGKVFLIHGSAGMGKTALAIKLGHLLKNKFTDGVLWYKVEEDNIDDILLSIARIFGEDISEIKSTHTRATVVRSLLSSKNVLIIYDSAELCDQLHLLIPNSPFTTSIITSQKANFDVPIEFIDIPLKSFSEIEVLNLFKATLNDNFSKSNTKIILDSARKFGNLPLAVHIYARHLAQSKKPIEHLQENINKEENLFQNMKYENKNLLAAIDISYEKLDSRMKSILVSASIFKGKDFSLDSIGYLNGLSTNESRIALQNLSNLSLVEQSTKNRYRIHPEIREFIREKLDYPKSSHLAMIATVFFTIYFFWWTYLQIFVNKNNFSYEIFAATYGLMALYGAIIGIDTARKWGGFKTLIGKSIYLFSIGLLCQEFGQLTYSTYSIFYHVENPYPSIGDIGFASTIPIYIIAGILLAKSSGIKISIQSFKEKILAIFIPIILLITAYVLFLNDYIFEWNKPIKILLDFGNPLGDAISISVAIIIFIFSRNVLDGIIHSKAKLLLFALVTQFVADSVYIYKSNDFYSGSYMDLLYLIAYFSMALALINLRSLQVKIKST